MMRYAGRPAMAESRILSYDKDNDDILWYYEDHKTEEKIEVKETGLDLLKRMIIHIPDKHFHMVRCYGFYNSKCQDILDIVHSLLGKEGRKALDRKERKKRLEEKLEALKFRRLLIDTYNRDPLKCSCGSFMMYIYTYDPLEGKHNDREYRRSCIDEMRELRLRRIRPS